MTAKDARDIVDIVDIKHRHELELVNNTMLHAVNKGKTRVYVYMTLKEESLSNLNERGFKIHKHNELEIEKSNLHYTISW